MANTAPKLTGNELRKAKIFVSALEEGVKRPYAYLSTFPAARRLDKKGLVKKSTAYAKRKRVKELIDKTKTNNTFDRTTKKAKELEDYICEQIARGRSLLSILDDDQEMPAYSIVWAWRQKDPNFEARFQDARRCQGDYIAETLLEIADDSSNDYLIDKDGGTKINTAAIQRSKLMCDIRKWFIARLNPPVWGDKVAAEVEVSVNYEEILNKALKRAGVD